MYAAILVVFIFVIASICVERLAMKNEREQQEFESKGDLWAMKKHTTAKRLTHHI